MKVHLLIVAILVVASPVCANQPRFGVGFSNHSSPAGALVVKTLDGFPCQRIFHEGDNRDYYLAAGLHVITEINGVRIGTANEASKAIAASSPRMKFRVYNRHSGSHRAYEVILLGKSRGKLDLGRSVDWRPGTPHSKYENVIAAPREGHWRPAPGYSWVQGTGIRAVRWTPGLQHPDHHIKANSRGSWTPLPGHKWISESGSDLRVRWQKGTRHPNHRIVAMSSHGRWEPMDGYG